MLPCFICTLIFGLIGAGLDCAVSILFRKGASSASSGNDGKGSGAAHQSENQPKNPNSQVELQGQEVKIHQSPEA